MITKKQSIKSIFLSTGLIFIGIVSCKNEKSDVKVIGTNEAGEELTVTKDGDTITLEEANILNNENSQEKISEAEEKVKEPEQAFHKNSDGTYSFSFNLEKGGVYPFKVSTKTTSTQSDGQNSQQMTQSSENELSYKVQEVKSDSYLMKVSFIKFKENNSMEGKSLGFDTGGARPSNELLAQQYDFYKAVVGNSFTMEISKDGKVLNVDGLKSIRNQVKSKVSKGLSEEEKKGLDQMLEAALSKQAMEMMFLESIGFYPTKPVKEGEEWQMNNSTENAKSKMIYTLNDVDDSVASINIKGNSSGKDAQTLEQGIKMFRSIEGTVDGSAKVDVKSGWLKNAEINKKEVLRITQEYKGEKRNMSSTTTSNTNVN